MNKILLTILSFCISLSCFAEDTYKTRFNAFTGKQDFVNKTIDSSNSSVDTTNFTNNLSSADDTVQKALDTIDDMSSGSSQWSGTAGSIIYYNSANVGIGTSAPSEKLQVFDGYIKGNLQANVGIGNTAPAQALDVTGSIAVSGNVDGKDVSSLPDGSGTANYTAKWTDSDTLQAGTIFDDGTNVGIGISAPVYKLDVSGTARVSTSLNTPKLSNLTDNGFVKTSSSDGTLSVDTTTYLSSEADTLNTVCGRGATYTAGNVGIGTTDVTLAAFNTPTIRIGTSTTTGYVLTASNTGIGTWQAATGGTGGVTGSKSFIITNPSSASDGAIWRTPAAITITAVHGVCADGTNIIGHLDECDADGANCAGVDGATDMTITTSNVNDDGTLSNASIDAGDYVGWHTTSVSGSVTKAIITYDYEE